MTDMQLQNREEMVHLAQRDCRPLILGKQHALKQGSWDVEQVALQ
jgi:hypothetical protein